MMNMMTTGFTATASVNKNSSMARTTGFTATASINLILNKFFTRRVVFPPEVVSWSSPGS